ncbi:MAG: leucine-rich repeat domain-containing protein [Paludibacteraceae bacterium]|nr:leucine-rich repeat domain-containing protein [Paludibacteraceae bacterium]
MTEIGEFAFNDCTSLKSVEIPSSVKSIGENAFNLCKSLKSARVPKGCEIGKDAFPSTCEVERY